MEKINLRDLKAISRYTLIDNMFSKVEENLQGRELEFYTLNGEDMKPLLDTKTNGTELEFLYQIIPLMSNVEVDVDFKEFEKMVKYPSVTFSSYFKCLVDEIAILFKTANQIKELDKETKSIAVEQGIELPIEEVKEVVIEKTTDEKLDELYAELKTTKVKLL
ncbi:MAG TPA: hypothetical protein VIK26_00575, partial [Clostridium sp.]